METVNFELRNATWHEAAPQIENGSIALFRGVGWLSKLIQYGTGGPYSHAGMIRACEDSDAIDLLEMLQFRGGRATPLRAQVERYPGQIDVYAVNQVRWYDMWNSPMAVQIMHELTGRDYGYRGVLRLALQQVPLLWRLWPLDLAEDAVDFPAAPFCSHAVCAACRIGGGVDPVPRKPDHLVTPNDLAWSLLFNYQFTLVP